MSLNRARILSSENDASMRNNQQQTTNVNIKLPDLKKSEIQTRDVDITYADYAQADYPSVSPSNNNNPVTEMPIYPPVDDNSIRSREINELQTQLDDLTNDISDLETKNKFLELLIQVYENNPIKLNSYLICKSSILMEIIKLLTNCDKVELIIDDNIGCVGCVSKHKYTYISKIFVTKNNKTEDLKYAYNDVYSKLIQHGISLKIVI